MTGLHPANKPATDRENRKTEACFAPIYRVVIAHDEQTPAEFTRALLCEIFGMSDDDATRTANDIRQYGRGIAGAYRFEIAEAKQAISLQAARAHAFPLNVTLEKEKQE